MGSGPQFTLVKAQMQTLARTIIRDPVPQTLDQDMDVLLLILVQRLLTTMFQDDQDI